MVSIVGFRVRPRYAIAVVAILIGGLVWWSEVVKSSPSPAPHRNSYVAPILNLSQGSSFESFVDSSKKIVSFTFPLVNGNSMTIFVRHVGSTMPGLTIEKTPEWSTQRPDFANSSFSETITYRVSNCSLVPRGVIESTLQARTPDGLWQTLRIPLTSGLSQQWQKTIVKPICSAASR